LGFMNLPGLVVDLSTLILISIFGCMNLPGLVVDLSTLLF